MNHPTTSQAVRAFFAAPETRQNHNDPALLDRYMRDMEVQVNVAADGGEPVPGRRNTWTDEYGNEWFNIRIPKNAKSAPERNDWPLKYDLPRHVEAIGMTGWDFATLRSRWAGFDFDAITGHAAGVGISDAELEAVKVKAWEIPWLEIRRSTGGNGVHLYALLDDEGIETANHTEHAAVGRAILDLVSRVTGFNFAAKVDACGGNMWVWHRKSSLANQGLKLLKPATTRLSAAEVGDWRGHLPVINNERATQRVRGVPDKSNDIFDELVLTRERIPFTVEHHRIREALINEGFPAHYLPDNHLVQVHTVGLAKLIADPASKIKGVFKTNSQGSDTATPNAFMFPLRDGGWRVYRFSPGTEEALTWDQGDGWTSCNFNVPATLAAAAAAEGGIERPDGSYVFPSAREGLAALRALNVHVTVPEFFQDRAFEIDVTKKGKLTLTIGHVEKADDGPSTRKAMQDNGWALIGVRARRWSKVVKPSVGDTQNDGLAHAVVKCSAQVRSLKTPDNQDAGWRVVDEGGAWVLRDRTGARDCLASLGISASDAPTVLGRLQSRNWTLVNRPFQPEFPGGRSWNIGAQLAIKPTQDDREMNHRHWNLLLDHLGKGLDKAVQDHPWCREHGIADGALYLLHWCASLFQRPHQKLPYLFFHGGQNVGKSSLPSALGLLMTRGHVEARNALLTEFNGELDGAILAYIEEVDLSGKGMAVYNRLKDLVTADKITVNAKYRASYTAVSHLHWIQVANKRHFCPVFEGDTRIVMIHVADLPAEDIPWAEPRERLRAEAPDFLRTLFDLRLPPGLGRLWLPVVDTDEKRMAIVDSDNTPLGQHGFDPDELTNAIGRLLLVEPTGTVDMLVSDVLQRIGHGPWSQDPGVFGKQLKDALRRAKASGLRSTHGRNAKGATVEVSEDFDLETIDALHEWELLTLLADFAMLGGGQESERVVPAPHFELNATAKRVPASTSRLT